MTDLQWILAFATIAYLIFLAVVVMILDVLSDVRDQLDLKAMEEMDRRITEQWRRNTPGLDIWRSQPPE